MKISLTFKSLAVVILLSIAGILSSHAQNELEEVLNERGIVASELTDLSDEATIAIDEPLRAIVNFTGLSAMPSQKTSNLQAWMEVYDCNGHYFKKRVILNAQGGITINFEKKNFSLDFCEDEWIGDATTNVTIGNWVTQDGFHLKAFYNDYLKGIGIVDYKLFHQIQADRTPYWQRAGVEGSDKALGHPDGFPCEVYLNGEFYGIYAWQLKKNRKNMNLTKDVAEHIHLDGDIREAYILGGNINWTRFEVKNPKNLYCIDTETIHGFAYEEITDNAEEVAIMGDNYVDAPSNPKDMNSTELTEDSPLYYKYVTNKGKTKYYKRTEQSGVVYKKYDGDNPKELIDETMPYYDASNKNHVLTAKVKAYIVQMSKYIGEIQTLVADGADEAAVRSAFEERFDKESWIDYHTFLMFTMNGDGSQKNWQWFTYDGKQWMVAPYDLDSTFGNSVTAPIPPDYATFGPSSRVPLNLTWRYYEEDIKERYKQLRESGVLSANNVNTLINNWYNRIGQRNYAREQARWPNAPVYNAPVCSPNWKNIPYAKYKEYLSLKDYSETETYHAGDRCKLDLCIWEATGTTTGVKPYVQLMHKDSLQRYLDFTVGRLEYLDQKLLGKKIKEACTYTLMMTSARWSTMCLPINVEMPENLKAYTIYDIDNQKNLKKKEEHFAEGYKPYLISGEPGIYLLTGSEAGIIPENLENGLLTGTLENGFVPADKYVLQCQNGNTGFYWVEEDDQIRISANKAYLSLPFATEMKYIDISAFDEEQETLPEKINEMPDNQYITGAYTISGTKISKPQRGLNIIRYDNGNVRKVFVP